MSPHKHIRVNVRYSFFFFNSCLGYSDVNVVEGSCASLADPCSSRPCPSGTQCVPNRHVCLSLDKGVTCPQFSCGTFFFFGGGGDGLCK